MLNTSDHYVHLNWKNYQRYGINFKGDYGGGWVTSLQKAHTQLFDRIKPSSLNTTELSDFLTQLFYGNKQSNNSNSPSSDELFKQFASSFTEMLDKKIESISDRDLSIDWNNEGLRLKNNVEFEGQSILRPNVRVNKQQETLSMKKLNAMKTQMGDLVKTLQTSNLNSAKNIMKMKDNATALWQEMESIYNRIVAEYGSDKYYVPKMYFKQSSYGDLQSLFNTYKMLLYYFSYPTKSEQGELFEATMTMLNQRLNYGLKSVEELPYKAFTETEGLKTYETVPRSRRSGKLAGNKGTWETRFFPNGKSQGTVDVTINLTEDATQEGKQLAQAMNTSRAALSLKNYRTAKDDIHILTGYSLLSVLSFFDETFIAHFLNRIVYHPDGGNNTALNTTGGFALNEMLQEISYAAILRGLAGLRTTSVANNADISLSDAIVINIGDKRKVVVLSTYEIAKKLTELSTKAGLNNYAEVRINDTNILGNRESNLQLLLPNKKESNRLGESNLQAAERRLTKVWWETHQQKMAVSLRVKNFADLTY